MQHILTYNQIAEAGLKQFNQHYCVSDNNMEADAIILRSHNLHNETIADSVKVIARAGAGVNNIPLDAMTARGIPVVNTPGANANAVKELVITGMLLACRNICPAWDYTRALVGNDNEMGVLVEKGKKQFKGLELPGRTLGIIGLGNIGVRLANSALSLGMRVIGFDPAISVENAWQMSRDVHHAKNIQEVISQSDFISVHVPLNDHTQNLLNANNMPQMKPGVVILNFARGGIVDRDALKHFLDAGHIRNYVTDFPSNTLKDHPQVISLPHLGASTMEAEQNCAIMAVDQIKRFLTTGEIKHGVNFPDISLPTSTHTRLAIANANVPNMVAQITNVLSQHDINIIDMINKSKGDVAFTLIDISGDSCDQTLQAIKCIEGVLSAIVLESSAVTPK